MKKFLIAGVVAFAVAVSVAFSVLAATPVRLRVGHVGHDHQLALFVAAELGEKLKAESDGYWLRELKSQQAYMLMDGSQQLAVVTLDQVGGGSAMPAALASGQIELGLGGVAPTVAAIDRGARIRIVAPLNTDGDMMLVRPDFPAKDWQQFVDAAKKTATPIKIGYKAPTAVAYLIFIRALDEVGISHGPIAVDSEGRKVSVITVNLQGGGNMVPAMAKGIVDGIVMNQPVPAVVVDKGFGRIIADLRDLPPAGKWEDHPCCCVAVTQSAIDTKPNTIRAMLAILAAAGRHINRSPIAMAETASPWTLKTVDIERQSIPTVGYVTQPDDAWNRGVLTWLDMMDQLDWFSGRLKDVENKKRVEIITDYSLLP